MKKNNKLFLTLIFAGFYLLLALFVPTTFSVTMPGDIDQVKDNIVIEGVENSTNFYTTSVYYMTRVTPITRMLLELSNKNKVEMMGERAKTISNRDDYEMGQVSKKHSYRASLINAYREASKIDNTISINYEVVGLVLYYRPSKIKEIKIGDVITKVNDEVVDETNYQKLILETKHPTFTLTIKRENHEFDFNYEYQNDKFYFEFYPNIIITQSHPTFELPGEESITGGPSGGLMQTLNIYVSLLNLNFGNLKIAGTGTINLDGSVGKIGGEVQKNSHR